MAYIMIWKMKILIQSQIDDYIGNSFGIFFDMTDSTHRRLYKKLFGSMGIKIYKKRNKIVELPKEQTILDQYVEFFPKTASKMFKMPYRTKLKYPEIPAWFAKSTECEALKAYKKSKGYLKHIFQLNSLDFWENLLLNSTQSSLYTDISIADVFKLEMARYKRGVSSYTKWIDDLKHIPGLIDAVQINPKRIPDESRYGKLVHNLGSNNIRNYFFELVKECAGYNLIDYQIIIWDGRFLRSFCANNENKKLKAFSDRDAGKYKHIGKFFGVGYIDSSMVCSKYNLSVYYDSYPANRNDNIIFRNSFSDYLTYNFPASKILLSDAGPYSNQSLELVRSANIIPLIFARKNIKKYVIRVADRKYINIKYVIPEIIPHLTKFLNLRTGIKRNYSPAKVCYHTDRMNNRGIENSKMSIGKLKCIELLTALTAIKVHRPDLINKPTAFRKYRPEFMTENLEIISSDKFLPVFNAF